MRAGTPLISAARRVVIWPATLAVLLGAVLLGACGGAAAPSGAPLSGSAPLPPPPTCLAVGDHVLTLLHAPGGQTTEDRTEDRTEARTRAVRTVFLERCERDAWAVDVRACVLGTQSLDDPRHCKAKLTPSQRAALERDLAAVARAAATTGLPPACAEYQATMQRVIACDTLPQASRDALQQGFTAVTQAWTSLDLPEEGRVAMQQACRTGTDALIQAVAATCGW